MVNALSIDSRNPFDLKHIFKLTLRTFVTNIGAIALLALIILAPPYIFTYLVPASLDSELVSSLVMLTKSVLEYLFIACIIAMTLRCLQQKTVSVIATFDYALVRLGKVLLVGLTLAVFGTLVELGIVNVITLVNSTELGGLLTIICVTGAVAGGIILAMILIRLYCLLPIVMAERITLRQCIQQSIYISKGYSWHILSLTILFVPFILSGTVLAFPAPLAEGHLVTHLSMGFTMDTISLSYTAIVNTVAFAILSHLHAQQLCN